MDKSSEDYKEKVLKKFSGLQNPLFVKSLNRKAFNKVISSLYFPVDLRLNLFFNSFSNLLRYNFMFKYLYLFTPLYHLNLKTFIKYFIFL